MENSKRLTTKMSESVSKLTSLSRNVKGEGENVVIQDLDEVVFHIVVVAKAVYWI